MQSKELVETFAFIQRERGLQQGDYSSYSDLRIFSFFGSKRHYEKLHSKIGRMWWTNNDKASGWEMMAWEKMCYLKGMGGIGF